MPDYMILQELKKLKVSVCIGNLYCLLHWVSLIVMTDIF